MRTRAAIEQTVEDAIEQNNINNLSRYHFEILLDIREWFAGRADKETK